MKFSELCGFSPKQWEATFVADEHQYTLFGGSRGPGKSYWLRWDNLRFILQQAKEGRRVITGLFCEDYPALKDRQISKISIEFPDWLGTVKDTKANGLGFHLWDKYGGGVMALRNLDDPTKYKSAEFARVSVDELTKSQKDTFDVLKGSMRWKGVPEVHFTAATNPGDVGHVWVKQLWIDRNFPEELLCDADRFAFVPALPDDNPHLEPGYWRMLETLPPALARAWRWGDWDVFEGQYFPEINRKLHGFSGEPPSGWTFSFFDYGEVAPTAYYWARVDRDGRVWIFQELYRKGLIYSALAKEVFEYHERMNMPYEDVRYTVAPEDIFQTSKGTGVVGANILGEEGLKLTPASRNNIRSRIEGWRHMREFLKGENPFLMVSTETCPMWWSTVPALVHDKHSPEDVNSDGEDHAGDATRYGLNSRPRPDAPEPERISPYSAESVIREIERERENW